MFDCRPQKEAATSFAWRQLDNYLKQWVGLIRQGVNRTAVPERRGSLEINRNFPAQSMAYMRQRGSSKPTSAAALREQIRNGGSIGGAPSPLQGSMSPILNQRRPSSAPLNSNSRALARGASANQSLPSAYGFAPPSRNESLSQSLDRGAASSSSNRALVRRAANSASGDGGSSVRTRPSTSGGIGGGGPTLLQQAQQQAAAARQEAARQEAASSERTRELARAYGRGAAAAMSGGGRDGSSGQQQGAGMGVRGAGVPPMRPRSSGQVGRPKEPMRAPFISNSVAPAPPLDPFLYQPPTTPLFKRAPGCPPPKKIALVAKGTRGCAVDTFSALLPAAPLDCPLPPLNRFGCSTSLPWELT